MEHISGYHILEEIGQGGMATVYKGVQLSLKRLVAIKILHKKLADNSSMLERFKRESLIIARLNNPHIIHVIDRGLTDKGMPYFVMEYVEGIDLKTAAMKNMLDFNRKLDVIVQICKALAYAHKNGVIHRDIKPSNVLIDQENNVRMVDFGIAQFYDDEDPELQHTRSSTVMGTLAYMSPEQCDASHPVTALSDLYSLGVVMYELFTGNKPAGRFQLPWEIVPALKGPIQDVIMACLETNPEDRPNSADDIKDRFLKILNGAHLKTEQKKRAVRNLSHVEEKFTLLDVIKESPQGSVYLYEDREKTNLMIIKKRPSQSTGFLEAKLLSTLRHDNIVDIIGTSKNKKAFIVVMAYLEGGSLKERLVQAYRPKNFLLLARQICEGLAFAHRNGIIHGNLRPSNILFTRTGEAQVTDFGLDEHYTPPKDKINWYNPTGESKSIQYDILAIGIIFFQMLTGTNPDWVDDALTLPPAFDALPIELQGILIKMFSTKKQNRYKSFNETLADLAAFMPSEMEDKASDADTTQTRVIEKEPPRTILQPSQKPSALRLLVLPLFFMLFVFAALFYLTYTGNIYVYIKFLGDMWREVLEMMTRVLGK